MLRHNQPRLWFGGPGRLQAANSFNQAIYAPIHAPAIIIDLFKDDPLGQIPAENGGHSSSSSSEESESD